MHDTLEEMCSNEQNISRVVDLYEKLFSLLKDGCSLSDYYSELKGFLDELDYYQPLILDLKVLQWYRDELAVAKFFFLTGYLLRQLSSKTDSWW